MFALLVTMPTVVNAQPNFLDPNADPYGVADPFSGGSLTGGTNTNTTPTNPSTGTTSAIGCQKDFQDIPDIINYATCSIGHSIIPLIFSLAMLVFLYGVMKYVIAADGSDDREEGRWFMIYGIIGIFVMVSVWGLVGLISNTFDIGTSFPPSFQTP
ncbi:MAG: hypothetical protein RL641_730 [Candidatus Parcubacteria bacterium]